MATHHSARPAAYSKRPPPPHGRSSRPTHLSKRSSSYAASKAGPKAIYYKEEDFEDEDSMATSFLQFWYASPLFAPIGSSLTDVTSNSTTCEKQIIVPNNSVLYCSERYDNINLHLDDPSANFSAQLSEEG